MRGVIYARYSSDNQREESIEGQIRECKTFAERNGIDIIGSYIDRAFSAKTDNRPDFQRMIKESATKAFDVILVWRLDRFARDRYVRHIIKGYSVRTESRSYRQPRRSPRVRKASCWSHCWKALRNTTRWSLQRKHSEG